MESHLNIENQRSKKYFSKESLNNLTDKSDKDNDLLCRIKYDKDKNFYSIQNLSKEGAITSGYIIDFKNNLKFNTYDEEDIEIPGVEYAHVTLRHQSSITDVDKIRKIRDASLSSIELPLDVMYGGQSGSCEQIKRLEDDLILDKPTVFMSSLQNDNL